MSYRCLEQQTFTNGPLQLIPIREEDIYAIKAWRNAQIDILRQDKILSDDEQAKYWKTVLLPSFDEEHPKQILFSYLKNKELIGYGGLVHINWNAKRAEVSFLLETSRTSNKKQFNDEFMAYLELLKVVAFDELKLHRLCTETFDVRPTVIACLEEFGFVLEGRLKDHVKVKNVYTDSLIHGLLNEA